MQPKVSQQLIPQRWVSPVSVAHMLKGVRAVLLFATAAGLLACKPMEAPSTTAGRAIRTSSDAQPGATFVGVARARSVFASLCVNQRGSPMGTEAAAAADGFVKDTFLGTYYHPRDNLSVKLVDGDCSMVFVSAASPAELKDALSSLTADTTVVRFRATNLRGNLPFYNARISVR